jgi:hypothetical protein
MQPCVYLQVLGYCFNALPDTVSDDQPEEAQNRSSISSR